MTMSDHGWWSPAVTAAGCAIGWYFVTTPPRHGSQHIGQTLGSASDGAPDPWFPVPVLGGGTGTDAFVLPVSAQVGQ